MSIPPMDMSMMGAGEKCHNSRITKSRPDRGDLLFRPQTGTRRTQVDIGEIGSGHSTFQHNNHEFCIDQKNNQGSQDTTKPFIATATSHYDNCLNLLMNSFDENVLKGTQAKARSVAAPPIRVVTRSSPDRDMLHVSSTCRPFFIRQLYYVDPRPRIMLASRPASSKFHSQQHHLAAIESQ